MTNKYIESIRIDTLSKHNMLLASIEKKSKSNPFYVKTTEFYYDKQKLQEYNEVLSMIAKSYGAPKYPIVNERVK